MLTLFLTVVKLNYEAERFDHRVENVEHRSGHDIITGTIKEKKHSNDFDTNKFIMDALKPDDLSRRDLFLIYVYYDRNNFNCANCKYFRTFLTEIRMNMKFINFGSNVFLGSKFNSYIFPAFIIRSRDKSYRINRIQDGDDLVGMVNRIAADETELTNLVFSGHIVPFSSRMEIGSFCNTFICYMNVLIFWFIDLCYLCMYVVPDWFVNAILIGVIIYLIYSIVSMFVSKEVVKDDRSKSKQE
ncbi:hypothetical protein ECANGB1_1532 [Enterospora canceri]|uniref:Thioredoxin domain-containing protein n=1 Tax=Enterospora canceri TaxID=1081671 RepID=A0A1Y1S5W5_9MICR|nr:hypothetical protein ECANGB1_1532 [Enterospora canceri]